MCHHFAFHSEPGILEEHFPGLKLSSEKKKYDNYPLKDILTIYKDRESTTSKEMSWGLLPRWFKINDKFTSAAAFQRKTFNARAETLHEKASYKKPFQVSRCIIPAHFFYEKGERFGYQRGEPLLLAGLYDTCCFVETGEKKTVQSATIVTTTPNSAVSHYHHRMPVVLNKDMIELWLTGLLDKVTANEIFKPNEEVSLL